LKIIDFNISKKVDTGKFSFAYDKHSKDNITMMTHIGNLEYSAPELLENYKEYTEQVDMWSSGMILYYFLTGTNPFKGENLQKTIDLIRECNLNLTGEIWDNLSKDVKNLVSQLLEVDPLKRLNANEALQHNWLKSEKLENEMLYIPGRELFVSKNCQTQRNTIKTFEFNQLRMDLPMISFNIEPIILKKQ